MLALAQRCKAQQLKIAQYTVQGRADFMAHGGQKQGFCLARFVC